MPTKENKTIIKQFSDGSSFWWVGYKCYHLNENNDIVFICGGLEDVKETELIRDFCKRNKKTYKPRAESSLDKQVVEYNEKFKFGKFVNKSVQDVYNVDKRYLSWVLREYNFKIGEEKLKTEITNILKK